jgi:hypothetical protein
VKKLSKTAFADVAGVTRQAVGQAARTGGRLGDALTKDGKIDANHPAAIEFVRAHKSGAGTPPNSAPDDEVTEDDLDELKKRKLRADIRGQELKNAETDGSLIPKELVESALLSLLEEQNLRLLNDVAKSIARIVQAHGASGVPLETSEREIRDLIGQTLKATHQKVAKKLRDLDERQRLAS